jgi:hypothetical protein
MLICFMRTTIDLPDDLYKIVRTVAIENDTTLRQMVVDGLGLLLQQQTTHTPRQPFEPPLIRSTRTDKLVIDNETIYDLIDFP